MIISSIHLLPPLLKYKHGTALSSLISTAVNSQSSLTTTAMAALGEEVAAVAVVMIK